MRGPAELAGIVGMRPSRGLISLEGIVPCDIAHDSVGPMASNVVDCATLFSIMSGSREVILPAKLDSSIAIACPTDWCKNLTDGQQNAINLAIAAFTDQGVVIKREGIDFKPLTDPPKGYVDCSFREEGLDEYLSCLLYTSPSPRDS